MTGIRSSHEGTEGIRFPWIRSWRPQALPAQILAGVWVLGVVGLHLAARELQLYELLYLPALDAAALAPAPSDALRTARDLFDLASAAIVPNLAWLAVGLWLLRALRLDAQPPERLALGYLLGSGIASLGIFALRACDAPVPMPLLAVLAASGIVAWRAGRSASRPSPAHSGLARSVDGLTLVVGALLLVSAAGPETSWDALEYHLPIVKAWTEGPLRALPATLDAELRLGVDMLFVPAVAAGHPDAAGTVGACFALALAALIRGEASRRASRTAGSCAGLLVLLTPLVLESAPTCFVDLGVGAYGFAALLFADRWNRQGESSSLVVAALAAAFAANAKLHAAVILPATLLVVLVGGRRPPLRALVCCGSLTTLLVLPWFVKTALTTGNPFFPVLGEWFGYGPFARENLEKRAWRLTYDFPVARTLGGFARYLYEINFGRVAFLGGLIGPLPLALGPLAAGRASRPTLALGATVAGLVVLQFLFAPAIRFGTPILPFLAIAAAVGGRRVAGLGRLGRGAVVIACLLVGSLYAASMIRAYAPRVFALRTPRAYERAVFPSQEGLRELVALGEPTVAITMGPVLWMPRPVYLLHWERNGEIFFSGQPPARVLAVLRRRGVRSLVVPVAAPLPRDGSTGHRTLDAWLRSGEARWDPDVDARSYGKRRVWVLIHLVER